MLYIKVHRVFNPLEGGKSYNYKMSKNNDKEINLSMKTLPYFIFLFLYIKGHGLFWTINWKTSVKHKITLLKGGNIK